MHNPTDVVVPDQAARMPDLPAADGWQPADDGRALYIEGLIALRDGDAEGAAGLLTAALRRQPTHLGMRRNLVRAFLAAGRFDNALVQAEACLAAAPDDAELHLARGSALGALGQPVKACAALTRAVSLQPDHAAACLNLGNAWADRDDLAAAERLCREAIRLDPRLAEAHTSLGYILTMRGDLPAAIDACEAAIRVSPGFSQAHWNLAIAVLLSGDLRRGFAEFEWRKRHPPYRSDFQPLPGPAWDGAPLEGRTILVRAEQGHGDTIQFARFLPLIRHVGGKPILICPPPLRRLLSGMAGVTVIPDTDPLTPYDAWIDLMTLPHVLGTTLETIPAAAGYLRADAGLAASWRDRLPAGLKVGIALAGNPLHRNDRRRSIPPEQARTLLDATGVSFVALQPGSAAGLDLPDLTPALTDHAQTAALIDTLDLVISVDTSVAHLAGAMGKPAWVLLAAAPDWRWMLDRADSPWYDSVRLFRQTTPGDWDGVLDHVKQALRSLVMATAAPA